MDINLLKTFLEVSKTRNFARAAENLYVTSAAVSARVKQLESQLGVTLFNRHRGNMQLTTEAERLLPLAETIISTWSRTLQEVSLQPAMESRVYIGAPASLWILAMEERLLLIRQKLPEVALQAEAHA
ncbi:MAG: LysR family transcriptional regulator, partial [Pseudomonadales bacterium]